MIRFYKTKVFKDKSKRALKEGETDNILQMLYSIDGKKGTFNIVDYPDNATKKHLKVYKTLARQAIENNLDNENDSHILEIS